LERLAAKLTEIPRRAASRPPFLFVYAGLRQVKTGHDGQR
jgi:hypothetical protein